MEGLIPLWRNWSLYGKIIVQCCLCTKQWTSHPIWTERYHLETSIHDLSIWTNVAPSAELKLMGELGFELNDYSGEIISLKPFSIFWACGEVFWYRLYWEPLAKSTNFFLVHFKLFRIWRSRLSPQSAGNQSLGNVTLLFQLREKMISYKTCRNIQLDHQMSSW